MYHEMKMVGYNQEHYLSTFFFFYCSTINQDSWAANIADLGDGSLASCSFSIGYILSAKNSL